MRRGRWTYQPDHQAWQLDDSGWYLRVRTGLVRVYRGCSYCWGLEDNRRWILYRVDPAKWNIEPNRYHRSPEDGICTHRRRLADAMPLVEKAFAEHVLKSLANL